MKTSIDSTQLAQTFSRLEVANKAFSQRYPGDSGDHQPIHTLYGGAQLYKAETTQKIGELSLRHFNEHSPEPQILAKALDFRPDDTELWSVIHGRVKEKLASCAVEDFRIDFEDGYGNRPDQEEDATAEFTAKEVARAMKEGLLPPYIGIRVKPFNEELKHRSARTLDIFVSTLIEASGGALPPNFVITLPKVCIPEQVEAFVELLEVLEKQLGLSEDSLKMEIMIETTQAIVDSVGKAGIPQMLDVTKGRCRGAHFGTYDYTACSDITAAHQKMDHPACDFALQMMKVAMAGTGIWLSDGATSVMPVAIHRSKDGLLSEQQIIENKRAIQQAWKLSFDHITHSLRHGYYQGWDLHPGQIPIRYAACYAFFLSGLEQASVRLKNFIEKAAQATLVGDIFDDAATGQGLLNYFLRALNSGAISEEQLKATGLSVAEVRSKSFVAIIKGRTT